MAPRVLALRTLAMVCGGIWITAQVVPASAQAIVNQWRWLRDVAIVVLVAFEGIALVAVMRVTFSATPDPTQLERHGIPPLLVKLMLAEARFWRWLWGRLRKH
ncbi:hypothetical protein ACFSAA_12825 [Sphingomonas qilianensis]